MEEKLKKFWYQIDRDSKKIADQLNILFEETFQTQSLLTTCLQLIDSQVTSNDAVFLKRKTPIDPRIDRFDFFKKTDLLHSSLKCICRVYHSFEMIKDNQIINEMIKLLKEKQLYRLFVEFAIINENSHNHRLNQITFYRCYATSDAISKSGPWCLYDNSISNEKTGLMKLTTWLNQMISTEFGRIRIQIPGMPFAIAKSFLGTNQWATFFRLSDDTVAKVVSDERLIQNEINVISNLQSCPVKILDASRYAIRITPFARKLKSIDWSTSKELLLNLINIHIQGYVHQQVVPENFMITMLDGRPILVNFEHCVRIGIETMHNVCSKHFVSDRILEMRIQKHNPYFPHPNDDLQGFVRCLLYFFEQIALPSNEKPKYILSFWRRVLHRRPFWCELDTAASRGNIQHMIHLIEGQTNDILQY